MQEAVFPAFQKKWRDGGPRVRSSSSAPSAARERSRTRSSWACRRRSRCSRSRATPIGSPTPAWSRRDSWRSPAPRRRRQPDAVRDPRAAGKSARRSATSRTSPRRGVARRASRSADLGRRELGDRRRVRRRRSREPGGPRRGERSSRESGGTSSRRPRRRAPRARSSRTDSATRSSPTSRRRSSTAASGRLDADVVYPRRTILSEHTLVVIDTQRPRPRARRSSTRSCEFLWSDEAQRIFVRYGFRSARRASNAGESGVRNDRGPVPHRGLRRLEAGEDGDRRARSGRTAS